MLPNWGVIGIAIPRLPIDMKGRQGYTSYVCSIHVVISHIYGSGTICSCLVDWFNLAFRGVRISDSLRPPTAVHSSVKRNLICSTTKAFAPLSVRRECVGFRLDTGKKSRSPKLTHSTWCYVSSPNILFWQTPRKGAGIIGYSGR